VIFAGPAYTGRRIIDFQLRNLVMRNNAIPATQKDSVHKAQVAAFDSAAAHSPWTKFFLAYDPLPTLRKVKAPVMILQGGTDQQVTPDQAPIIARTLQDAGNRDVTLRVLPNHNHLFLVDSVGFHGAYATLKDGRIGPEVMGPLADWLALKLAAPPRP
jgi:pimeloyl-ACP methyl ester carboxylesterase